METATESSMDGLEQLQAKLAGGLGAPIGQALKFDLVEVERGRAVFEGRPDRSVYNPLGAVHGGYAATLLDSACGIATHSALGPGRSHTTLELNVSYLRPLSEDSGLVRAIGRVISVGKRVAFAEATLHDEAGRICATGSSTLLVFDLKPRARGVGPG